MKLIYGRAGSGKSEYIFDLIKENSRDKIYIVTPEQFSYTAEKRLMETLKGDSKYESATTNVEVLSFARMAYNVIKETIPGEQKRLEKSGKAMLIFEAISEHQKELNFLGKSLDNVQTIITQITELKKHNITVEMLEEQVNNTQDKYLKAKLNDILILYKDLEEKIPVDFVDENDLLTLLAENIENSHLFDNAIFFLDEFAGFTKQEYAVIERLNEIAKELYITICTDELRVTKTPDADIFYDNKQTVQTLSDIFEFDKDKQIRLANNYRFKNEELKHLEKNIFDLPYNKYEKEVENIKLYLAENQYNEVEYVATNIVKLVRNNGYKFSDIAVICNNIDTYSSLCKAIFDEYDIPVFIDDKKDITQNILIKYLMSILEIYSKSFSYDSVFNYIKTGLVGVENINELENYCLKWGIQGKKFYKDTWNFEEKDNFVDEQKLVFEPLLKLKEDLNKEKNAKNISKILYNFLVEQLVKQEGKVEFNQENEDAWNLIVDVLAEISNLFGDKKLSFDEYLKVLKTGMSTKELGKIPSGNDNVTVGDVNRSKTHKVKAVFIIGVNDGVFPSNSDSEGFLNDKDRANLKEENFELAKGTREKMYEENFNIYKAFSTAEEKLFISYASSDTDGKPLRKSLIISKLRRIFPELKEDCELNDEVLTKKITFEKLLNNIDSDEWKEVLYWYKKYEPEKLERALAGLKYSNIPDDINEKNINKLYGNNLKTSVSKLEDYSSCPFSYYLTYGLKLSEKDKLEIKPIDTGSFMHDVIDRFFKTIMQDSEIKNSGIGVLDDDRIKSIIDEIVNDKLHISNKFNQTAKFRTLVKRLERVVFISIKYIVESLKNSEFEVLGTEIAFDTRESAKYPPIEMDLENGKKVSIIGKIDRVDIAKMPDGKYIRIIDYKSSAKDIELNKFVAGLQLQLITYVDAMCKNEDVMPAGALYFTLLEPKLAQKDLSAEDIERKLQESFRMKGLVLADINVIKAMDETLETGKSTKIPVSLNKDGDIAYSSSNTVTRDEFERMQKHSTKLIKQISKQILSGDISVKPYYDEKSKSTPCQYCKYRSICQFDPKLKNNDYRFVANVKKQEVLDNLK